VTLSTSAPLPDRHQRAPPRTEHQRTRRRGLQLLSRRHHRPGRRRATHLHRPRRTTRPAQDGTRQSHRAREDHHRALTQYQKVSCGQPTPDHSSAASHKSPKSRALHDITRQSLRGCRVMSCSAMQQSDAPGPVPATGASQRPQRIGHSRSDCTGGTDASPPAQTSATASKNAAPPVRTTGS